MKIWEFLEELAFFYPPNIKDEDKKRLYSSYVENLEGIVISNKCEYDWKKVLQAIQRTYTFSKFPPLAEIIKVLPECVKVKPYQESEDEGALVVITMPNGVMYDFTITGFGKPLSQIKSEIVEKYGNVQVKTYPKGSVLIGKQVILP